MIYEKPIKIVLWLSLLVCLCVHVCISRCHMETRELTTLGSQSFSTMGSKDPSQEARVVQAHLLSNFTGPEFIISC